MTQKRERDAVGGAEDVAEEVRPTIKQDLEAVEARGEERACSLPMTHSRDVNSSAGPDELEPLDEQLYLCPPLFVMGIQAWLREKCLYRLKGHGRGCL